MSCPGGIQTVRPNTVLSVLTLLFVVVATGAVFSFANPYKAYGVSR